MSTLDLFEFATKKFFTLHIYNGVRAAFGCNNDSRYNTSVSYHCFPSDKALQDDWLARISRADLVVTKHSRLCSLHFTPDDYEHDLRAELTGRKRKRDLKTGVIPSIFSHRPAKKPRPSPEKRLEEKARQEVGPNKLYNYECKQANLPVTQLQ